MSKINQTTEDIKREGPVTPFIRIVPTGMKVETKNGERAATLKMTAIISPDPIDAETSQNHLHLSHWPMDILGRMTCFNGEKQSWGLDISLTAPDGKAWTLGPLFAKAVNIERAAKKKKASLKTDLQTLWAKTFLREGAGVSWQALRQMLEISAAGASFQASQELEKGEQKEQEKGHLPDVKDDGAIEIDPNVTAQRYVDGICSQQHTELALAFDYGRAARLCDQISEGEKLEIDEGLATLTQNPQSDLDCYYEYLEEPTDAEKKTFPEWRGQKYEKAYNTYKQNLGTGEVALAFDNWLNHQEQAKYIEDLAKERTKARADDFQRLKGNFEKGKKAYLAEKEALAGSQCLPRDSLLSEVTDPEKIISCETTRKDCVQNGVASHAYASTIVRPVKSALDRDGVIKKDPCEAAGRLFFAIQSTGALQRLYCLAFDLEVTLTETQLAKIEEAPGMAGRESTFAKVRAHCDNNKTSLGNARCPAPWTMTRIALRPGDMPYFWPETKGACEAAKQCVSQETYCDQMHGYLATGELLPAKGGTLIPRFDLSSLDIRSVTEQEIPNSATPADKLKDTLKSTVFHTAGIVVLDRAVQQEKAIKLARRDAKLCKDGHGNTCMVWNDGDILYADDLTIGYRMDVGLPKTVMAEKGRGEKTNAAQNILADSGNEQKAQTETVTVTDWRAMHLRLVSYGSSGDASLSNLANELMPLMAGGWKTATRMGFDASILAAPEQLLPKVDPERIQTRVDLSIPENVANWTGSPLGLDVVERPQSFHKGKATDVKSEDVLPFGRSIDLPTGEEEVTKGCLPPPLRFGWPYRFAQRAVYSGGVSVPVGSIQSLETNMRRRLSFPALKDDSNERAFFRFLRHKSVDQPVILMPKAEALKAHGDKGAMGYQENEQVTLRSVRLSDAFTPPPGHTRHELERRAAPDVTYRIVLPPELAMEDVAYHGVLDRQRNADKPRGAFRHFRRHRVRKEAGFPVIETRAIQGFDGAWVPTEPRSEAHIGPPKIVQDVYNNNQQRARAKTFTSTPLAQLTDVEPVREYYPDPFAQVLVISPRLAGTRKRLEQKTLSVDVYPEGHGPRPDPKDALPIVLTFKKAPKREHGSNATAWDDLQIKKRGIVQLKADGTIKRSAGKRSAGGQCPAIEIEVQLPQGMQLEFDLWYAPKADSLSAMSALTQAVAVYAANKDKPSTFDIALKDLFGACNIEPTKPISSESNTNIPLHFAAPGGFKTDLAQVRQVAECLAAILQKRPLPDLAAANVIHARHATNDVSGAIQMVGKGDKPALALHRIHPEQARKIVQKPVPDHAKDAQPSLCMLPETIITENETNYQLDGCIDINLNQASGFDIIATMISPGSGKFDDFTRRRDLASMRSDHWPTIQDREGNIKVKTARQLFGFDLQKNGRARLPEHQVILYRVRDLPTDPPIAKDGIFPANMADFTRISLFKLLHHSQMGNDRNDADKADEASSADNRANIAQKTNNTETPQTGSLNTIKVSQEHKFIDCAGRQIMLHIQPISRTLPSLRTTDRLVTKDIPENALYEHLVATHFPAEAMIGQTEPVKLVLAGTERPAKPATKNPGYCFKRIVVPPNTSNQVSEIRKPIVRLYLDRPWFSTDSEERLGVVLWPPNQLDQKYLDLREPTAPGYKNYINRIHYHATKDSPPSEARDFKLDDFRDEDLGKGGRYITRLGADPLKQEIDSIKAFMSYQVFSPDPHLVDDMMEYRKGWASPVARKNCLVENVAMPLGIVNGNGDDTTDGDSNGVGPGNRRSNDNDKTDTLETMMVSLVLFAPRFDPDRERWYVDIEMQDHSVFSEPLVRFGLVRYAPNARPDLRLSPPTVVWANLLPERHVDVHVEKSYINVKVTGRTSGIAIDPLDDIPGSQMPQIYATLMHESSDGEKTRLREHINLVDLWPTSKEHPTPQQPNRRRIVNGHDAPWVSLRACLTGGTEGAYWSGIFGLDNLPELKPGERILLYLNEIEHMRPASYPDEPIDHVILKADSNTDHDFDADYLVESGPRFSWAIELYKETENNAKSDKKKRESYHHHG
ncbi:MAG: hypothetical protein OIF54_12230 [Cohaesibacter sp.]|nr:hypothetical protein [Cohaesibacter sp.]